MSNAALRSQRERKGEKECDERWQEETNSQATGMTSSMMLQTSKNSMFLSHSIELMVCRERRQIFMTNGTKVIARGTIHQMQECNHEEAGTRLLVHLLDAIADGVTTCLVRTVDIDVIFIIACMACLSNTQLLIYGWPLALENISGMCTSMLSAVLLENRNPWHFLYWL